MSKNISHQSLTPFENNLKSDAWVPIVNSVPAFSVQTPEHAAGDTAPAEPTAANTAPPHSITDNSMLPKSSVQRSPFSQGHTRTRTGLTNKNQAVGAFGSLSKKTWDCIFVGLSIVGFILMALAAYFFYQDHSEQVARQQAITVNQNLLQAQLKLLTGAKLAVQGSSVGFRQLKEGLALIRDIETTQPQVFTQLTKEANYLLAQESNLLTLSKYAGIGNKSPIVELSTTLNNQSKQLNAAAADQKSAQLLEQQMRELSKSISLLLSPDVSELNNRLDQIKKTAQGLQDEMTIYANGNAAVRGGRAPIILPQMRTTLADLIQSFSELRDNLPKMALLGEVFQSRERLELEISNYTSSSQRNVDKPVSGWSTALLIAFVCLTLAIIICAVLFYLLLRERHLRTAEIAAEREQLQNANRLNQQGIVRLMDDLRHLADGDLTIRATVSEDITGSIADSINITIEEFSSLVERINESATRVTKATESARKTSSHLLAAADTQAIQIKETGRAALEMARALSEASEDAKHSAATARTSLEVAEKGSEAVRDALRGMNEIRDHIQETAQRIKRLGDSSLEIGEIVEIIDDITEQTNVLALNAAIQAATAGEAGRGFGIVAQEVQRLAERSAQATQQISSIVKTIQNDTSNAIAAMEHSTQFVVKGSERANSADSAISELQEVATNVAKSVELISEMTLKHSESAGVVTQQMQEVLHFTNQTTTDTKQTAESIEELTRVAVELKTSVAGFKVR